MRGANRKDLVKPVRKGRPAGTVLFTGDYGITAQPTVPALSRPDFQADLVFSASTQGERLHEDRTAAEERLLSQIRGVVAALNKKAAVRSRQRLSGSGR